MEPKQNPLKREFKVQFEGIELTTEQAERINVAVRTAVLTELATLDFGGFAVDTLPLVPEDPYLGVGVKVFRP